MVTWFISEIWKAKILMAETLRASSSLPMRVRPVFLVSSAFVLVLGTGSGCQTIRSSSLRKWFDEPKSQN